MLQIRNNRPRSRGPRSTAPRAMAVALVIAAVVGPSTAALSNHSAEVVGASRPISSVHAQKGEKKQPICSMREVPYEDAKGRKYLGKHGWRGQGSEGPWNWSSDAVNWMKEFCVCSYEFPDSTRNVAVTIEGLQIDFTNRDGSGAGGGLMLALYHEAPPSTLFKGKEIKFDKSALQKREWIKKEGQRQIKIDGDSGFRHQFSTHVNKVYLVVVGVDPWIDTSVSIHIDRLTVSPAPPPAPSRKRVRIK